jgi:hypothetical protein
VKPGPKIPVGPKGWAGLDYTAHVGKAASSRAAVGRTAASAGQDIWRAMSLEERERAALEVLEKLREHF